MQPLVVVQHQGHQAARLSAQAVALPDQEVKHCIFYKNVIVAVYYVSNNVRNELISMYKSDICSTSEFNPLFICGVVLRT